MRTIGSLVTTLAIVTLYSGAHAATLLSGNFVSTATDGEFPYEPSPHGFVDVTGTTVTGSFSLSSLAGIEPTGLDVAFRGPGGYDLPPGAVTLSFDVEAVGQTFVLNYADSSSLLQLMDNGASQTVLLSPEVFDPHGQSTLSLTGPEGSLFDNISDPTSLHVSAGVSVVSAQIDMFLYGNAQLEATSSTVVFSPIDEPATFALAALPFAFAAVRLARRAAKSG